MYTDPDIEIIDFLDLINVTLSNTFIEKWKYKYSEKFIKHFQLKILQALNNQKPLKLDTLFRYLTKKCKYSPDQVNNFFDTIEIDLYKPLITIERKKWKTYDLKLLIQPYLLHFSYLHLGIYLWYFYIFIGLLLYYLDNVYQNHK